MKLASNASLETREVTYYDAIGCTAINYKYTLNS